MIYTAVLCKYIISPGVQTRIKYPGIGLMMGCGPVIHQQDAHVVTDPGRYCMYGCTYTLVVSTPGHDIVHISEHVRMHIPRYLVHTYLGRWYACQGAGDMG